MSTTSQRGVERYRVRVEEYQLWTEYLTSEELKAPRASGSPDPKPQVDREAWIETENLTTKSKSVLAGILRAKADELDPPGDGKVYR